MRHREPMVTQREPSLHIVVGVEWGMWRSPPSGLPPKGHWGKVEPKQAG